MSMFGWFTRRRAAYDEGYRIGHADARRQSAALISRYEGLLVAKESERLVAVQRGDALMDKLMTKAGVRGVTATAQAADALERDALANFQRGLDADAFEEVSPGPDCYYANAADALIDPGAIEPEEIH